MESVLLSSDDLPDNSLEIIKPLKLALIIENTDYSTNHDVDCQSLPVKDKSILDSFEKTLKDFHFKTTKVLGD